jgi:quercetin dioxygenase-like cupin family protein
VIEGEYEVLSGERTLRVGAGSALYVPKGILRAHRVVGEGMGMLVTQTPGGLYERFFGEVAKAVGGREGWR